jgi:O-methyltransferase involved in polyketide biosynthesis
VTSPASRKPANALDTALERDRQPSILQRACSLLGEALRFDRDSIADDSLLARARTLPTMNQVTSLWKGGLSENAPDWLRQHGWQVQTHDHSTLAATYGRPAPDGSAGGFLTGVRLSRR